MKIENLFLGVLFLIIGIPAFIAIIHEKTKDRHGDGIQLLMASVFSIIFGLILLISEILKLI